MVVNSIKATMLAICLCIGLYSAQWTNSAKLAPDEDRAENNPALAGQFAQLKRLAEIENGKIFVVTPQGYYTIVLDRNDTILTVQSGTADTSFVDINSDGVIDYAAVPFNNVYYDAAGGRGLKNKKIMQALYEKHVGHLSHQLSLK